MWMSSISDFHDSICKCWTGFAHLLDLIFPEGHKDRDLTVRQIIERDFKCLSGGDEEESHGLADGDEGLQSAATLKEEKESSIKGEEIEDLIAAAEEAR